MQVCVVLLRTRNRADITLGLCPTLSECSELVHFAPEGRPTATATIMIAASGDWPFWTRSLLNAGALRLASSVLA